MRQSRIQQKPRLDSTGQLLPHQTHAISDVVADVSCFCCCATCNPERLLPACSGDCDVGSNSSKSWLPAVVSRQLITFILDCRDCTPALEQPR